MTNVLQELTQSIEDYPSASAYFERGEFYYNNDEFILAKKDFDRAIKLDKKNPEYYFMRFSTYIAIGDFKKAFKDVDRAIKLDNNPLYIHMKAHCYELIGDIEGAALYYGNAINVDPKIPRSYLALANLFRNMGDYRSALRVYNAGLSLKNLYQENEQDETALNLIFEPFHYNRGILFCDMREYERAFEDFQKAIRMKKPNFAAKDQIGFIFMMMGNFTRAEKIFKELIEEGDKTQLSHYHFNLGNSYFYRNKYEEAIKHFSQTLKLDQEDIQAHLNRGNCYRQQGDLKKAIVDYSQAIDLDPDYTRAYKNRGLTYFALFQYELALEDYHSYLKLGGNDHRIYRDMASIYFRMDNTKKAMKFIKKALAINDNAEANLLAARILVKARKIKKARNYLQHSFEIDPQFEDYALEDAYLSTIM